MKTSPSEPLDGDFSAHYNPCITVFRSNETDGYQLYEQCDVFDISAIAVAAPVAHSDEERFLTSEGRLSLAAIVSFQNKIRTIFRVALLHGHDSVVLGAFGCGSFRNPPRDVALIFKDILKEREFKHSFKKVIFAVINDHNGKDNFQIFSEVFA